MTITRREALKALAASPIAAGLSWTRVDAYEARRRVLVARAETPSQDAPFVPQFFTAPELAMVTLLADLIIPADDRSGSASDAGVAEFMDFMMVDQPTRQLAMRGGLAWLDREHVRRFDRTFVDSTDDQRRTVLDAIAWPDRADPVLSHGVEFFSRFRDLTATGFWTSRLGIEDLAYQGNVPLVEWAGCPDEALRRLGVRYDDA